MSVDERANVLILKDEQDVLAKAELLVRELDRPVWEVVIESRVVEATRAVIRNLGIDWQDRTVTSPEKGNPAGLVFPNLIPWETLETGGAPGPHFVVNMPAEIGVLSMRFGSIGSTPLGLGITSAEIGGTVRTVSGGRTVTPNNAASTVHQSVSAPFPPWGSGTPTLNETLTISAVPDVAVDGSITMKITVETKAGGSSRVGAGSPSMLDRVVTRTVLVRDGDVIAIAGLRSLRWWGIAEDARERPRAGVDQPRSELVAFLSPRIINRRRPGVTGDAPALRDSANLACLEARP